MTDLVGRLLAHRKQIVLRETRRKLVLLFVAFGEAGHTQTVERMIGQPQVRAPEAAVGFSILVVRVAVEEERVKPGVLRTKLNIGNK